MTEYPVSDRFKVTLNGIDLSKWINVSDVQRNVGQNRKATLIKVGRANGKLFQYTTSDEGTITIKGDLDGDSRVALADKRHQLADAITTSSLAKLWFEDEPNTYYLAISDGQAVATEDQFLGEVTITFSVPDGLAHSLDTKTYSTPDTDGNIVVLNNGTAPVYPVITATMTAENGLVAFTTDTGGVLQFGNPDEVDGVVKQKSERAIWEGFDTTPSGITYNNAKTNYPNYVGDASRPNKQQGKIKFYDTTGPDPSGGSAAIPTFTNGSTGDWGGPSMQLPIKANSNGTNAGSFLLKTRFYFATSVKQQGRMEMTLQNDDGVAYSAVVRDSNATKDEMILELFIKDKMFDSIKLDRKAYTNGMYRELMIGKLGSKITMQLGAVTDIKTGNTTTVRSTVVRNYDLDYMVDVPVTAFSVWYERYKNTNHVVMDTTDVQFTWVNVDYWADMPNRFESGDVVMMDVENKTVYVNGVEDLTLQAVGEPWDSMVLQPGVATTIQPVASSWANPFSTEITVREAFV